MRRKKERIEVRSIASSAALVPSVTSVFTAAYLRA